MRKTIWILFIIILLGANINSVLAEKNSVDIYFFYGETCSHCKEAEKFLDGLKEKYPELQISSYEVLGDKENAQLLLDFFERHREEKIIRVPAIFIEDKVIIGYAGEETTGKEIEALVKKALGENEGEPSEFVSLPLIGKVNLSRMSLPVLAIALGALDGLNPCAMWVLLFLLALLINARSRKRMWLIGGTFILASGLVYFLLLTAWLNLFLAISYVNVTRISIGIFALGVGIWQIKNFIQFRPGICKVTDAKSNLTARIKNGLRSQAERLALSPLTLGILAGIVILALGVNLVEFFCSAGLPAIFTRILALSQLSPLTYYLYLLLYTLVFMLDDLIIFSLAFLTLSKIGFSEKYNKWTTLLGGLLIFILGVLLIFRPEILMFG